MLRLSELGMRLKAAREEKGYSLEELQTITKIQKRYLTAIEEGDFSRLPGDFYARAFVKRYADAVGIDPEKLFEEHSGELPQPKREPAELPPRATRSKPKIMKKKTKFAALVPTLFAVIFITAIAVGIWAFGQRDGAEEPVGIPREEQQGTSEMDIPANNIDENEENNNGENASDADNNEPENANEEEDEESSPEQSLEFEESQGNNAIYTLSNTDNFEVRLEFSGDSWLQLTNGDGESLHMQTHSAGDEEEFDFSGEEQIEFNLGHTPTVDIYINDELLEYELEVTRQYVTVHFEPLEQED
ncbi:helix-turn-helix domain-containing protein [Evansella clarkii]|uniref:helix-turn-helix domain-containing protein n=1 Tax=Evansella clarkii TaxID=79879 RepID=UPI0039C35435